MAGPERDSENCSVLQFRNFSLKKKEKNRLAITKQLSDQQQEQCALLLCDGSWLTRNETTGHKVRAIEEVELFVVERNP